MHCGTLFAIQKQIINEIFKNLISIFKIQCVFLYFSQIQIQKFQFIFQDIKLITNNSYQQTANNKSKQIKTIYKQQTANNKKNLKSY